VKAAFILQPGPPDTIQFGDLPTPKPTGSQVRIRVEAVAVNPIDTYVRSGAVRMELPQPFIVGCDLAGVVEAVGPRATRFRIGDRVWGSNQGLLGRQGTFAEFACVDDCWLHPTPACVSAETAAAGALVGITAHLGLVQQAGLQPDEVILVNGASGAVGCTVVQMARLLGARVIATVGSPDRAEAVRALGAELVLDRRTANLATEVRQHFPDGVNVWWETSREPDFDRAVAALAPKGRFILMAGRDARPPFPVGPFYVKGCSLRGFAMFAVPAEEQRPAGNSLNSWMAAGQLRPRIARVLPLSETATAHRLQEENTLGAGGQAGKLVLVP